MSATIAYQPGWLQAFKPVLKCFFSLLVWLNHVNVNFVISVHKTLLVTILFITISLYTLRFVFTWPWYLDIDKIVKRIGFYNVQNVGFRINYFDRAGMILGLRPANGRRRYKVTPSLIGWAQA